MASSGSVGTLSWSAKLDSNDFKKGVRKVKKEMKEAQKAVGQSLKIMGKGFAIATGAVAGLTVALGAMVKQSADVVNSQKILADSIGATQAEIAGMELVADSLGVSYDQLIDKMREFGGIDEFKKLADQVAGAESATESMRIAQEALGNEGLKLLPVLQQGAEGLRQMEQEALRLGLALPEEKVNALTTAWGAFEKAMQMVRGLTRQLSAELGESFGRVFVIIQSLIDTFRGDLIKAFKALNKGFVTFTNFVIEQVNNTVIPAFIAFQEAVIDVGEAIGTLYDFFFDSPISGVIGEWKDDFLLFASTIKESLAVGIVGVFQKAFEIVSSIFSKMINMVLDRVKAIPKLLNEIGVLSDKAFNEFASKVDIVSDAFDITRDKVIDSFEEIKEFLQEDLNKAVDEVLNKTDKLRKDFKFSITTKLADYKKALAGGVDEDGKDPDPIKVEVDTKAGGTLATAGSVEEFNLIRDQRNQELDIAKKSLKELKELNKNKSQPAGLNK